MDAKHQFKYTYNDTTLEEYSPVEVTFEVPGDVTLTQMLYNFQCYLKACGFVFDGSLEIIDTDTINEMQDKDWDKYYTDYNGVEKGWDMGGSAQHMADTTTASSSDNEWTKAEKAIKEWNEGIAKLDNEQKIKAYKDACKMSDLHNEAIKKEVKKNKWVHGICNPPSKDLKSSNSDNYNWTS
jgi:hypothetical protein